MYSQSKNGQSSVGVENHWSMDLITRRTKRRSILGKGRSSLRLSVAGTIPPASPGTNAADKNKVAAGGRKPIAEDVLRHFARTNGINPLNPFANQLKESIGSGQSLEENEQEAGCSVASSSSEGSARKEDPDITGVFFMDDVESVKKRQLDAANSAASSKGGAVEKGSSHTVSCNLMTRSPFAKQPLKDQALRLNRAAEIRAMSIRTKGGLTSSSSKRRTSIVAASADKAPREYSSSRQAVLSPVEPVLKSCVSDRNLKLSASSQSLSSSVSLHSGSSSLLGGENADCASSLRRSVSTTDLTNCIAASGCTRDARRAASEMHFEEMCKVRCESLLPTNMADDLHDLFVSKRNQVADRTSVRPTTDHQSEARSHCTTDSSRSRGRYSVASYTSDSNTKKSRPSIMSDLIINHNSHKYGVNSIDDMLSSKKENDPPARHSKHTGDTSSKVMENDVSVKHNKFIDDMLSSRKENGVENRSSKYVDDVPSKKENDVLSRSKYIDELLKRIDLSVKVNKHTDDTSSKLTENVDDSSSNVGNVLKSRGNVDGSSSKFVNDGNEKEVCNKFNRTLVFDDDDDNNFVDEGEKSFVYNESVCNETLQVPSAGKIKKLSVIEEEELRSRLSSANEDESLLESTIRGGNISVGSTELGGKINERLGAILEFLQESSKELCRKRGEFVEGLKREQKEFVRLQNERIEAFERYENTFTQEQTSRLAAMCADVAKLTDGNSSSTVDDEVFHTALKKPLPQGGESNPNGNNSNSMYSQLKSDFKCLKTPNARSNKKAPNLNKTILTPHSMSVCVQEQVSMLFDALD